MKTFVRGAVVAGGAFEVTREREARSLDGVKTDAITLTPEGDRLRVTIKVAGGQGEDSLTFGEFAHVLMTGLRVHRAERQAAGDASAGIPPGGTSVSPDAQRPAKDFSKDFSKDFLGGRSGG